jgi:hypothetical protein
MRELIATGLEDRFRNDRRVAARLPELEDSVRAGRITSFAAARQLLSTFTQEP